MEADIELEVHPGETWITRDQTKVVIDRIEENDGDFPIRSADRCWMRNGRFSSNEISHSKDLIRKTNEHEKF